MLEILIYVGIALAAFFLVIIGLALTKPKKFVVERSQNIQASPAKIYEYISDFHHWKSWSPWEKLDPEMQATFSGAEKGKGAVYEWLGNKKAGQGRMEILDAEPERYVSIKLDFIKPFPSHNTTTFKLEPQAEHSTVMTWRMEGPMVFMGRVMSVFINMEKMVGRDFENGLLNLKELAEK
ncbi:SRPBCC family protein [Telmatocola sphagniphila]|uniref:SRPBCC family protein n=1 Tax=Telmatocola sphagniphila TaxID=1123043 RepID=A0A8E6B213_9BACT|nr:SRPBCC family protein [Telmatocola sphagniphila]QVL30433.1 SRPBCC family protein [Telmatocola sphagniphila]